MHHLMLGQGPTYSCLTMEQGPAYSHWFTLSARKLNKGLLEPITNAHGPVLNRLKAAKILTTKSLALIGQYHSQLAACESIFQDSTISPEQFEAVWPNIINICKNAPNEQTLKQCMTKTLTPGVSQLGLFGGGPDQLDSQSTKMPSPNCSA